MRFIREDQLIFERYVVLNEKVSPEAVLNALDQKDAEIAKKLFEMDATKSKGHALKLAKFFNQIKRMEVIQDYYTKFLDLKKRNRIKDITQFEKFSDLENEIDSLVRTVKTGTTEEPAQDEPPIYEDSNISVQQANTRQRCVKFGERYGFCISKKEASNMFSTYRLASYMGSENPTFYFVWAKKRNPQDNKHMIVIGAGKDDTWNRTFADNRTEQTTPEQLVKEVPELKPAFDKNVFKHVPLTSEEREKVQFYDKMVNQFDSDDFEKLSYQQKAEFLQLGSVQLPMDTWKKLNKELRNEYLKNINDFHKELIPDLSPSELEVFKKQMLKNPENAYKLLVYADNLKERETNNER